MSTKTNPCTSFFDCRFSVVRAAAVLGKPAEILGIKPKCHTTFRVLFVLVSGLDRSRHSFHANPKFFNTRIVECDLFRV